HLGREMTLQLPRYRRSLLVDLWTRRLTSCSSLLHRAPFVAGLATKPTKEWPDLFPLSRYVTRKGSGDGLKAQPSGTRPSAQLSRRPRSSGWACLLNCCSRRLSSFFSTGTIFCAMRRNDVSLERVPPSAR